MRGPQLLLRAMGILELFEPDRPTWSLTEIVEATGLPSSTTHRILQALKQHNLLVSDPVTRRYSIGHGVMRLARTILESGDMQAVQVAAGPHLESLRRLTGETVGLHCRVGDRRVCVAELQSQKPIRMATTVGGVQMLHTGAASKALLAWLPSVTLRRLLHDYEFELRTDRSPQSLEDLEERLAVTRDQGYATSYGESVEGAAAVAAPIFGAGSEPVAVINITGPEDRWTEAEILRTVDALLDATRHISQELGFQSRTDPSAPGRTAIPTTEALK